jgi:S-adenosylmethionine:tRNA ribosyltransferase-isomerase
MKTSDFDYHLPPELIAQHPIEPRDASRLLVVDRRDGSLAHRRFKDLPSLLVPGDVLVFNDSRVIPARLKGIRPGSGGAVELLLLKRLGPGLWEALTKPAKRLRHGGTVDLGDGITAEVVAAGDEGIRTVRFSDETKLFGLGEMPLPPYIHEPLADPERYQTVYARETGSAAAPTAGLHFTPVMLNGLERMGVRCVYTTLHVGLDTFRPVTADDPRDHVIHREYGVVSREAAEAVSDAREQGRRVICVGTTSVRLIEQAAALSKNRPVDPFDGWADLFILPGYRFRVPDALLTNFHLPKSSLLMLVSAFAEKDLVFAAYREAVKERYRFYSFGDAMLIL